MGKAAWSHRQKRNEKTEELRPPPGAIFPRLKLGQGEAQSACKNVPHVTHRMHT